MPSKKPPIIHPPVIVEPAAETKRGILQLITDLFKKQDMGTLAKEATFIVILVGGFTTSGVFQCNASHETSAKIDTVRTIDSTRWKKRDMEALQRDAEHNRKEDSIIFLLNQWE